MTQQKKTCLIGAFAAFGFAAAQLANVSAAGAAEAANSAMSSIAPPQENAAPSPPMGPAPAHPPSSINMNVTVPQHSMHNGRKGAAFSADADKVKGTYGLTATANDINISVGPAGAHTTVVESNNSPLPGQGPEFFGNEIISGGEQVPANAHTESGPVGPARPVGLGGVKGPMGIVVEQEAPYQKQGTIKELNAIASVRPDQTTLHARAEEQPQKQQQPQPAAVLEEGIPADLSAQPQASRYYYYPSSYYGGYGGYNRYYRPGTTYYYYSSPGYGSSYYPSYYYPPAQAAEQEKKKKLLSKRFIRSEEVSKEPQAKEARGAKNNAKASIEQVSGGSGGGGSPSAQQPAPGSGGQQQQPQSGSGAGGAYPPGSGSSTMPPSGSSPSGGGMSGMSGMGGMGEEGGAAGKSGGKGGGASDKSEADFSLPVSSSPAILSLAIGAAVLGVSSLL